MTIIMRMWWQLHFLHSLPESLEITNPLTVKLNPMPLHSVYLLFDFLSSQKLYYPGDSLLMEKNKNMNV